MSAYVKTVWVNDTAPAVNDVNLNKIEQGIYDAHVEIDTKVTIPASIAAGEVPVWDGSGFARSSVTRLGYTSLPQPVAQTPAWTAATTNPVLGNGTITASYTRLGKLVLFWGILTMGSTTTFGSGEYRIALPFGVAVNSNLAPIGVFSARDSSSGNFVNGQVLASSGLATTMRMSYLGGTNPGAISIVTEALPWVWANGDTLYWSLVYEAA